MRISIFFFAALFSLAGTNLHAQLMLCGTPGKYNLCDSVGNTVALSNYDTLLAFSERWEEINKLYIGVKGGKIMYQAYSDSTYVENVETGEIVQLISSFTIPYFKGSKFDLLGPGGQVILADAEGVNLMLRGTYDGFEYIPHDLSEEMNWRALEYVIYHNIDTLYPILVRKKNKWGAIDIQGKTLAPIEYDDLDLKWHFNNLHFLTKKQGKAGITDLTGKVIIDNKYDAILDEISDISSLNYDDSKVTGTHDNTFALVKNNGKTGVIDVNGKELIPPKYDALVIYNNRLLIFNVGGTLTHVAMTDTNFYEDPDNNFEMAYNLHPRTDSLIAGGKWGIVDYSGKEVVPAKYDFLVIDHEPGTSKFVVTGFTGGKESKKGAPHHIYPNTVINGGGTLYEDYLLKEAVEGGKKSTIIIDGAQVKQK